MTNRKIDNYYDRYDPAKNYTRVLVRDGYGMQASEINEIESMVYADMGALGGAMFKDGDIIAGAQIGIDEHGHVRATEGKIWLNGLVRNVPAAEFDISTTGIVAVGVRIVEEIISELEDPGLLNPAIGQDTSNLPGAWRLKTTVQWAYDGDGASSGFFPVYTVEEGVQRPKEAPPAMDSFNLAIARYDRDSTGGGSYVCEGLGVIAEDLAADGAQIFSISAGRARVNGEAVEFLSSWRHRYDTGPDLRYVDTEVITATDEEKQRVNVAHAPVHDYVNLRVTQRKKATVIHGNFSGCQDALPDTAVLGIVSVKQGDVVYAADTDYRRVGDTIDWSPGGKEPATGSSYEVVYDFLNTNVEPLEPDYDGFSVTGAVPGSSIMISYNQALPRIDRLCLASDGSFSWARGVASEYNQKAPRVSPGLLALASIYQSWRGVPEVVNDADHVFAFSEISRILARQDYIEAEVARNRLEMDAGTREAGTRAGLFVDPFTDDSMRDQGVKQTAAIVDGCLTLPLAANILDPGADIAVPTGLAYDFKDGLAQTLRTTEMKVNPYMSFAIPEAKAVITPSVDRWVETKTEWASDISRTFYTYSQRTNRRSSTTSSWRNSGTKTSVSSSTSTSTSTATENMGTKSSAIAYLRQVDVNFSLSGFGAGEILDAVNFAGVNVSFTGGKTADANGKISGSFKIPANIPAGVKQIEFKGRASVAYATFTGQGTLEVTTLRRVQNIYRHTTTTTTVTTVRYYNPDPLAQTFSLEADAMLAGVDLWFTGRGTTNAQVQLREVQNGFPTSVVLAEAVVEPASQNLSGHTRIAFPAPAPLEAGLEYALVILSNDADTALAIAEMGGFDKIVQQHVSAQPYTVGTLLSSSNASTWTAHQNADLAFRLLLASYPQKERVIELGAVTLPEGTSDLILMGLAETPSSACRCEFVLELPDGSNMTLAPEQGVSLDRAVSGSAQLKAKLFGDEAASPILWPGTQIIAGQLALSADYCTRSIVATNAAKAVLIYDAYAPSGSTVTPEIQIDSGAWQAMPLKKTTQQGDGIVEYQYEMPLSQNDLAKVKLTLSGSPKARPEVYDLRFMTVV